MAEALCGPSNPLQVFQKQTGLDRTLQQDRLVQQRTQPESFRSASQHTGSLDADFEAFHASSLQQFSLGHPQVLPQPDHGALQMSYSAAAMDQQPSWVADFSRLHLPLPQTGTSTFVIGGQDAQTKHASPVRTQIPPGLRGYDYERKFYAPAHNMSWSPQASLAPARQPQASDQAQFDERAFQSAFDAAHERMMAQETRPLAQEPSADINANIAKEPVAHAQLALLRYSLFLCITHPTEQHIHEAALFMSLLEDYGIREMQPEELVLLRAILMAMEANHAAVPYYARYDLQDRAQRLQETCREWQTQSEGLRLRSLSSTDMHMRITKAQLAAVPIHDLDAISSVATDPEMQVDLEMQLRRLKDMPAETRMLRAITESSIMQSHLAKPAGMEHAEIQRVSEKFWEAEMTLLAQSPKAVAELRSHNAILGTGLANFVNESLNTRGNADSHPRTYGSSTVSTAQQPPASTEPTQKIQHEHAQAHDDLSRTAGELLDKVAHDTSSKFQNSTFLDLMRKLKNREVQVEGEQMVPTDTTTARPTDRLNAAQPPHVSRPHDPRIAQTPSANGLPPIDGQEVINLLNQPVFGPQDLSHEFDPIVDGLDFDEQQAELGAGLFYE